MKSRRQFFSMAGMVGGAAVAGSVSRVAMAALPEPVIEQTAQTRPPLQPSSGRPYRPVTTLNGWTLPFRMRDGVKEFHLVAEPVVREFAPGFKANLWGYNGQSPGPTIEVVEGDKLRIFVTNRLPESTTIHWHGQRLPNGMDGVTDLTQPTIPPGKTFVYEFVARRPGTFMYHPHTDEMVQMAMGMMGFWVTHPRTPNPLIDEADRDFCFLLNAFDIDPGSATPRIMTMLDFNIWGWNSRVFPGIDPLVVRLGDRVRMRVGNLTMTNHPIHLHGHEFLITGTDGGPIAYPNIARQCCARTDTDKIANHTVVADGDSAVDQGVSADKCGSANDGSGIYKAAQAHAQRTWQYGGGVTKCIGWLQSGGHRQFDQLSPAQAGESAGYEPPLRCK